MKDNEIYLSMFDEQDDLFREDEDIIEEEHTSVNDIAIVGIAVNVGNYQEPEALWEALQRGEDFAWQNFHVKTIVNPRLVKDYISPHFPLYVTGAWSVDSKGHRQRLWYNHDVDFGMIRCNHYFCKSREEFAAKQSRGMADRQEKYDFHKFEEYDLNEKRDDNMLRYVEGIKRFL